MSDEYRPTWKGERIARWNWRRAVISIIKGGCDLCLRRRADLPDARYRASGGAAQPNLYLRVFETTTALGCACA